MRQDPKAEPGRIVIAPSSIKMEKGPTLNCLPAGDGDGAILDREGSEARQNSRVRTWAQSLI
jgi:hypothetical protein